MPSNQAPGTIGRRFVADVDQLLAQQSLSEALELSIFGVEAHPTFIPGWFVRARAHAANSQSAEALDWLNAVFSVSPDHGPAQSLAATLRSSMDSVALDAADEVSPERPVVRGKTENKSVTGRRKPTIPEPGGLGDSDAPMPRRKPPAPVVSDRNQMDRPTASKPNSQGGLASETLGDLYAAQGDLDAAAEIYEQVFAKTGSASVAKKLADLRPTVDTKGSNRIVALEQFLASIQSAKH